MNILEGIVEQKRVEVLLRKKKRPVSNLSDFAHYRRKSNPIDPGKFKDRPGIIAEFKRMSPSKGPINMEADPVDVSMGYYSGGVAAMSILTDRKFFGGSFQDLLRVRQALPELPLLRKDFIVDPYQLHEASAYGADIVLLIAAILDRNEVEDLALEAVQLGLQVLLEVHSKVELNKYHPSIGLVGVNNRDLRTFRVDTGRSLEMIGEIPDGVIAVSESGLGDKSEIAKLYKAGYRLFLMGENFMKESDPGLACELFIKQM